MSIYARVDLSKCTYSPMDNYKILKSFNIPELNEIYKKYCRYKKFKSVMPIFESDYTNNDVIGYYDNDKLVAFSIIIRQDKENVEALQFAWDYKNPKLFLGLKSLRSECAIYRDLGFKYMYLGEAHSYKKQIEGFEVLGPL
jgi:hypothetical protein